MPFQILCLSGGGYLGLYSAALVAALEEHTGRPVAESFDLIAGTSIGGIIALGLAARRPAAEIRDAFLEHGPKIFSAKRPPPSAVEVAQLLARPTTPKFGQAELRGTIEEIVGADLTMGDLFHRVMVPAVNLTKGKPQVFKTAHHPTFVRDWRLKVVDVALATSAAPTYFPIHRIGGEMFADGGLYANSPDQLALHEAEHFLEQPLKNSTPEHRHDHGEILVFQCDRHEPRLARMDARTAPHWRDDRIATAKCRLHTAPPTWRWLPAHRPGAIEGAGARASP